MDENQASVTAGNISMCGGLLPTVSHFLQSMIKNIAPSTSVSLPGTSEMYE